MKNKTMFGVILYKKEKEKNAQEIIDKHVAKSKLKEGAMFSHGREKNGWVLEQIPSTAFSSYNGFDDFLYCLSVDFSKAGIGLVLGHNDEQGFFWMDYPTYEDVKPYAKSIIGDDVTRYFECCKCGAIVKEEQYSEKYVGNPILYPKECYENQGGCGRISNFLEVKRNWVLEHHPKIINGDEK